ncbi:hypothetical protein YC2023_010660 [Brassica napus]
MAEVFCVCRQWSSKESLMWEFNVDKNRNASFIYTKEDLQYENLMKMVSKDCSIKEEEICLSYGISLDLKSIVEVITDSASCTKQTTDTFASHVPLNDIPDITDSASCNKQTTDTYTSPAPLNAIPVFGMIFFFLRLFRIGFLIVY